MAMGTTRIGKVSTNIPIEGVIVSGEQDEEISRTQRLRFVAHESSNRYPDCETNDVSQL